MGEGPRIVLVLERHIEDRAGSATSTFAEITVFAPPIAARIGLTAALD